MILAPSFEGRVNRRKMKTQRGKAPLGVGAGNGAADCCVADAGAVDWPAGASAGGAVVRLRTIFLGLGAGGAAAVLPSSSGAAASGSAAAAGSAAGAGLTAAGAGLPFDLAPRFDFGSSGGAAGATATCGL